MGKIKITFDRLKSIEQEKFERRYTSEDEADFRDYKERWITKYKQQIINLYSKIGINYDKQIRYNLRQFDDNIVTVICNYL